MSSFSLHIATDNAAFDPNPTRELRRILARADAIEVQPTDRRVGVNEGLVLDTNGNAVGRWFWHDHDQTHDDAAALDAIRERVGKVARGQVDPAVALDDIATIVTEWTGRT